MVDVFQNDRRSKHTVYPSQISVSIETEDGNEFMKTELEAIDINLTELCHTPEYKTPTSGSYPDLKEEENLEIMNDGGLEEELMRLRRENNALRKENSMLKAKTGKLSTFQTRKTAKKALPFKI